MPPATGCFTGVTSVLIKKSVILAFALLSSACGYHLRGALQLPSGIKDVYLQGGSAQLQQHFNSAMKIASIALASSPEKAGIIVRITGENDQRRALSLNSGGAANDFELEYGFNYELLDAKNKVLMPLQPVEIKREYYNDQLAVLAKGNEEALIRKEMYQQAVRSIMNGARIALETGSK
jgi:LPS-assembly lipoprotein